MVLPVDYTASRHELDKQKIPALSKEILKYIYSNSEGPASDLKKKTTKQPRK